MNTVVSANPRFIEPEGRRSCRASARGAPCAVRDRRTSTRSGRRTRRPVSSVAGVPGRRSTAASRCATQRSRCPGRPGEADYRRQSIGVRPAATSAALARLKGFEPKNPLWADSGLGWADSMITWRLVSIKRLLPPGRRAPEDEHDALRLGVHGGEHLVGEHLPPLALVRRRLPGAHGQRRVEQQHALTGPRLQRSMVGGLDAEVVAQLLEDVDERRRLGRRRRAPRSRDRGPGPGPWYGSWPRIITFVSAYGVRCRAANTSSGGGYIVPLRRRSSATKRCSSIQYGLANSPRSTGFQSVVVIGSSCQTPARSDRQARRDLSADMATASTGCHVCVWRRCRRRSNAGPELPGGARLWVKRDDLTGLGGGGNKARKLEFLCGEALAAGARVARHRRRRRSRTTAG